MDDVRPVDEVNGEIAARLRLVADVVERCPETAALIALWRNVGEQRILDVRLSLPRTEAALKTTSEIRRVVGTSIDPATLPGYQPPDNLER